MIADSEHLARARLRKLPDGKWFSRVFGTAWDRRDGKSQRVPNRLRHE